jgi:hypothetical protein
MTSAEVVGTFGGAASQYHEEGETDLPAGAMTEIALHADGSAQVHDLPFVLSQHRSPTGLVDARGTWELTHFGTKQGVRLDLTIADAQGKLDPSRRPEEFQFECHRRGDHVELWFVLDADGAWFILEKRP